MTRARKQSLKKSRNLVSRKNNVRNRKVGKITRKQRGGEETVPHGLTSVYVQPTESEYAALASVERQPVRTEYNVLERNPEGSEYRRLGSGESAESKAMRELRARMASKEGI